MGTIVSTPSDHGVEEMFQKAEERSAANKSELLENMRKWEKAGRGRFKLELLIGQGRSTTKPYPGCLSFWESGTQLHGGGDGKIYVCPGKMLGKNECTAYIPYEHNQYGVGVCPTCGRAWKDDQLIGEIMGKHTTTDWALLLWTYFMRFDSNCDIYLKHFDGDLQKADEIERGKHGDGELYAKAKKATLVIYPLKNIMRDSAHTDILSRLRVFLNT